MSTRRAHVEWHLSDEELRDAIKKADDQRVVRRLCFVRNLSAEDTIEDAAWRVGATQGSGSQWLERWNEDGQDGLIPSFGGGQPPKLSTNKHEISNVSLKKDNPGRPPKLLN